MSAITTNIVMVGPSGVGKTSLLASMYANLRAEVGELDCSFTSSAECSNELDERRQELERLATGPGLRVDLDLGPKPSKQERVFDFKLHVRQGIPDINVQFVDLPGGWYVGQGDFEAADGQLARSQAVIVAVDAWALMEDKQERGEGRYNAIINRPRVICEALERASTKLTGAPPIILFVLVKSEKYLHEDRSEELIDAARVCYGALIDPLKRFKHRIAVCAVETVGGLELNSVREKDGRPMGNFRRLIGGEAGYHPRHCSIPLRLVFKEALDTAVETNKPRDANLIEKVARMLGIETELSRNIMKHTELKRVAERIAEKLRNESLVWL